MAEEQVLNNDADEGEDDKFLDMSDDDFNKLSIDEFEKGEVPTDPEPEPDDPKEPNPDDDPEPEPEPESDDDPKDPEPEPDDPNPDDDPKEPEPDDLDKDKDKAKDDIDYKALYEDIMAPFKADGEEFTPKSPEDLKRLAQMGVNYHGKMAGMKPARKALLTLQNNGLLDEGKLDFLIDISKGNPEAIAKLLKEQDINPLDVDVKAESTYVPEDHSASEEQLQLDGVLKSIEGTPSYSRTVDILTKTWDDKSQTEAATNPNIISIINEHVDSGVYDTVMTEVKYQRSLGNLVGLSDLDAYKQTGDDLHSAGKLAGPANSEKKAEPTAKSKPVDAEAEAKRLAKKKSAKMTKTNTPKKKGVTADFNPLDLSDDDFEKFDPKLLGIK